MDPKETIDYVMEGMKWLIKGGGVYTLTLIGVQLIPLIFAKKIKSKENLERIVIDEAGKLGIKGLIYVEYDDKKLNTKATKLGDKTYKINLDYLSSRYNVRHELYHIHKHFDSPIINFVVKKTKDQKISETKRLFCKLLIGLNYFFREEPQATVYGLFGVKL